MATSDLIDKANDPVFYQRVFFLALKTAQAVATEADTVPDYPARAAYAKQIVRGDDSATLLAAHVIASNGTIQSTINAGNEPPDADIEFALSSIWTSRALAFAAV